MSVQIATPQLRLKTTDIVRIADEALEHRARIDTDEATANIWCKDEQARPVGAVFVLAHEVYCVIDHFDQVVWFNRTDDRDELWAYTDGWTELASTLSNLTPAARAGYLDDYSHQCACVFSVARAGSFDESLLDLVCCYFSTGGGAPGGMDRLVATGYISEAQFRLLFQRVKLAQERERMRRAKWTAEARENETEIIHVARELGLYPEPTGTGPVQWRGRCPRVSGHPLMITTSSDEFFCGYCSVSGGVDELRAFYAKQQPVGKKARQTTATTQHDETGEIS